MFVKYKDVRINIDINSHFGSGPNWAASKGEIAFFTPESWNEETGLFDKPIVSLYMGTPEMAARSVAMIDRHISRGRSVCNLDLLNEYDKKGHIVLLTELIRRTINRIAGRLGL